MYFNSLFALSALLGSSSAAAIGCPYAESAAAAAKDGGSARMARRAVSADKKGIFYMNRIGPSGSTLFISNADGSNAKELLNDVTAGYGAMNYHSSWSPDGEWIVFTSERRGFGQSDLYRVRTDGSDLQTLVQTDSVEDNGVLSPDGTMLAYVSTYGNYTTNVWLKDLTTNTTRNLTDTADTRSSNIWPTGHYRPSWSPNGEWIAFSSDRNTDWTGHSDGVGWEHTQSLGLYIIRPNGSDFRAIFENRNLSNSYGSPNWSPDGTRLTYSNMTTENTYFAHGVSTEQEAVTSYIYSVDVATGTDIVLESEGILRVSQHYIGNSSNIGYVIKAGTNAGVNYTLPDSTHVYVNTSLRNPSWSPDGSKMVYEIFDWTQQPAELPLWSFDDEWDYRYMDVFPQHSTAVNRLATTQKVEGYANGSAVTSDLLYGDLITALDSYSIYSTTNATEVEFLTEGESGAFQPTWNPDGTELLVGFGAWFVERSDYPASIWRVAEDGTFQYNITTQEEQWNAGFPSWSPDGTAYIYRLWEVGTGVPQGLWTHNFTTNITKQVTDGWDNTPGWSPDGSRIVFTRNNNWTQSYGARWYQDRFDVYTMNPDGSDLVRVTDSLSNDAHAVWTATGEILWSSGMYGFKDESALQDNTFQPYGQILLMDADGSNKRPLVDTIWEDAMPIFIPSEYLPSNITL